MFEIFQCSDLSLLCTQSAPSCLLSTVITCLILYKKIQSTVSTKEKGFLPSSAKPQLQPNLGSVPMFEVNNVLGTVFTFQMQKVISTLNIQSRGGPVVCPLQGNCQARAVVYRTTVTESGSGKVETYTGVTEVHLRKDNF